MFCVAVSLAIPHLVIGENFSTRLYTLQSSRLFGLLQHSPHPEFLPPYPDNSKIVSRLLCVHVCTCRGLRSTSRIFSCSPSYVLKEETIWSSRFCLDWLASDICGSVCIPTHIPQSWGYRPVHQAFKCVSESELRPWCLHGKHFTTVPSPQPLPFFCKWGKGEERGR